MKLISNNEQLLIVQLMLSRNSGAVTTQFFHFAKFYIADLEVAEVKQKYWLI